MYNTYANIKKFGNINSAEGHSAHPLTVCMASTMDKSFQNGSIGHLFGPKSRQCQGYMAQKCADKWDGYCEYFYQNNGPNSPWPQNVPWPNTQQRYWESKYGLPQFLTSGEQMLRSAAERRFCTYQNCHQQCEPFDPTNPNSPKIVFYRDADGKDGSCMPLCTVNPSIIDADPLMDRMLANPNAAGGTILNICNTAKQTGLDLSGTKIGKVCEYLARQ